MVLSHAMFMPMAQLCWLDGVPAQVFVFVAFGTAAEPW